MKGEQSKETHRFKHQRVAEMCETACRVRCIKMKKTRFQQPNAVATMCLSGRMLLSRFYALTFAHSFALLSNPFVFETKLSSENLRFVVSPQNYPYPFQVPKTILVGQPGITYLRRHYHYHIRIRISTTCRISCGIAKH